MFGIFKRVLLTSMFVASIAPVALADTDSVLELFENMDISVGATLVVEGTNNANGDDLEKNSEDSSDASYSVDLSIEKDFGNGGIAFVAVETGDGAGVDADLAVYAGVNGDAADEDNSFSLTEAWYEYSFENLPLVATVGKIDSSAYADSNEIAGDETTQFLGAMFSGSAIVPFPDNAFGVRLGYAATDFLDIDIAVQDADSDWDDVSDGIFAVSQLNFKTDLDGKAGNYRLFGWYDDRGYTKWSDENATKEHGIGFGISIDQQVSDNVAVFARAAMADEDVYLNGEDISFVRDYSAGVQLSGALWNRDDDALGIAFGVIEPSDEYKDSDSSLKAECEKNFEIYYSYKVNDNLTISPDLQVVWDPSGKDAANGDKTILVWGIRAQLDF